MEEQDITEQIEKHREYIGSLSVEDIIERIIKAHDSTDVILEGYNLVTNVNEGHGIALAGIVRLRSAIEELMDWFDYNLTEEAEQLDPEEL